MDISKNKLIEFFNFIKKEMSSKKSNRVNFSTWHQKPYSDYVDLLKKNLFLQFT